MSMKEGQRVKILILGQSHVGKSSLLTQYVDQTFTGSHLPTIGVQFKQKNLQLQGGSVLRVQIWDTAGTERYRTITNNYYRNIDGVLLVYDITEAKSFEMINYWVQQLHNKTDVAGIQLLLVGNKSDLQSNREISKSSAQEIANKLGIMYCQTSAKQHETTKLAFDALVERIIKKKNKIKTNGTIIKSKQTKSKKENQCCK